MVQAHGVTRPGGRTARTRQAVREATRALLAESDDGTVQIVDVAARSGVHVATIYRRWRTVEGLILDTVADEVATRSPVPATGELRSDLLVWVTNLLAGLRDPGHLAFFRALARLGGTGNDGLVVDLAEFTMPRTRQFQATFDAAGVTTLTPKDIFELVLSPAYIRALVSLPMDPAVDAERLVDNVLAVHNHRSVRG